MASSQQPVDGGKKKKRNSRDTMKRVVAISVAALLVVGIFAALFVEIFSNMV